MLRSTSNVPLIMEKNPYSPIAEAYRTLRMCLELESESENRPRVIAITSSNEREGKTTTAINLAMAIAMTNKKVLLIDGNLQKPVLHEVFKKSNRFGIINILMNQCDLDDATEETHIPNLSLISSGQTAYPTTELLATKRLEYVLEQARSAYDLTIIDSPSVLGSTDAQILAARCDGVLLVAQAGKVKRKILERSRLVLDQVKANVLGAVLNQAKKKTAW